MRWGDLPCSTSSDRCYPRDVTSAHNPTKLSTHHNHLSSHADYTKSSDHRSSTRTSNNCRRFILDPTPLFHRKAIVIRGSLLWRAKTEEEDDSDWTHVVKDQWRSLGRDPEGEMLKHALEIGVSGVAQYVWHSDLCRIDEVRKALHGPTQSDETKASTHSSRKRQ